MSRQIKTPRRIGDILEELLKNKDFHLKIKEKHLFDIWEDVVGEASYVAQPLKFKKGQLLVGCKSSAWAQEMEFRKEEIKKRLNEKLQMNLIKKIRFLNTPEKF